MRLLIDTHAFVWATISPSLLSPTATDAMTDPGNEVLVSAVTAYEIDYKRPQDNELQRMPLDLNDAVEALRFGWLNITWRHAREAARLPRHHRDPWDRIVIAQALLEDAVLVTADRRIGAYGLPVLW